MRWSWPIGRLAGIPLRVHVTFPLLLLWVAYMEWRVDRDVAAAASLVVLILLVFGIVVLHELGHALAARRYGVPTRDITLLPIGGVARLERIPKVPRQELIIALAGPAVNVVIAAVLAAGLALTGGIGNIADAAALLEADPSFDLRSYALRLVAVNVWLVLFNMLPAFPMDGGRVLRALLAMKSRNHAAATQRAAAVGRAFALLFGAVGLLWLNSPLLVLIAVFVWIAATGEAASVQTEHELAGATLERLIITDLRTVDEDDPLHHVADLVIAGFQQDFPVLVEGRYVGMLSRTDLVRGLATHGRDARVGLVMDREAPTLTLSTAPLAALPIVTAARGAAVPVLQDGRVAGLLTAENLREFLMLQRAVASSR